VRLPCAGPAGNRARCRSWSRSYISPAFAPNAAVERTYQLVAFVPELMHRSKTTPSFDYLIGAAEHRWWDGEAERFGSLEIDDQLVLCRRLHREIRGLLAFKDAIDVSSGA
jgi:hypothetical protein